MWLPIESAPKDDHPIIVFDGRDVFPAYRDTWWWRYNKTNEFYDMTEVDRDGGCHGHVNTPPTHWQPLPEPPQ